MSCFSTKNVRAECIGMLGQSVYRANGLLSNTEPNPPSAVEYGPDIRCLPTIPCYLKRFRSFRPIW